MALFDLRMKNTLIRGPNCCSQMENDYSGSIPEIGFRIVCRMKSTGKRNVVLTTRPGYSYPIINFVVVDLDCFCRVCGGRECGWGGRLAAPSPFVRPRACL